MSSQRKTVFLPIETAVREMDARLWLGASLANEGYRVVVGQHDLLHKLIARAGRPGIYVGKNLFRTLFPSAYDDNRLNQLRGSAIRIAHLDEEGAVCRGASEDALERFLLRRLDPRRLGSNDFICCWGQEQAELYASHATHVAPTIQPTGHPRFDLYDTRSETYFQPDRDEITAAHGRVILVNTSYARANPALGIRDTFAKHRNYAVDDQESRRYGIGYWAYETQTMAAVVRLCARLASEHPNCTLVVRPHPAESIDLYESSLGHARNVVVTRAGSVAPWIMSAAVVLHSGCTTAIEAGLARVPVVNFRPFRSAEFESHLPFKFGRDCFSEEEAAQMVDEILVGHTGPPHPRPNAAGRLLANLSGPATPRIVSVVHTLAAGLPETQQPFDPTWRAVTAQARAGSRARSALRLFFPDRRRTHAAYRAHFPGARPADIRERLGRIGALSGSEYALSVSGPHLFSFELHRGPGPKCHATPALPHRRC